MTTAKKSLGFRIMAKLTAFLDRKLAKYRPPKPKEPPYTPKTEQDLVEVIHRTPQDVLNASARNLIATAMSFDNIPVSTIMSPRKDIVFLHKTDFLGPLLFDKLYKSGADICPVLDKDEQVCGLIDTKDIDPLKITEETPITKYIKKDVYYVRTDYSLEMLLAVFVRENTNYCLVIDREEKIKGFVTLDTLTYVLFGREISDSFNDDTDSYLVATRKEK